MNKKIQHIAAKHLKLCAITQYPIVFKHCFRAEIARRAHKYPPNNDGLGIEVFMLMHKRLDRGLKSQKKMK